MNLYQSKPKLYFDLKIKPNIEIFFLFCVSYGDMLNYLGANDIGRSHAMWQGLRWLYQNRFNIYCCQKEYCYFDVLCIYFKVIVLL